MTGSALLAPSTAPHLQIHKTPRAHLVGIAGTGMRSLARVLDEAGWAIAGSDTSAATLTGAPYTIYSGHDAEQIDAELDLVVHSDAVDSDNPELVRARELGLTTLSYPQMLGRLMASRSGLAVAGTHGKSTTTAMAGNILTAAGFDPTVIYGAAPLGAVCGGRYGRGRWMLAEACEYRANFRHLTPQMGVILGIERDHFDCFPSTESLEAAFAQFAERIADEGLLLVRSDCPTTQRVAAQIHCTTESFGLTGEAAWQATALRERQGYYSFEIRVRGRLLTDVKLQVPGRHNVINALAAAALASHCGATASAIRAGLERFIGLRRRLQLLGEVRGVAILDDYAHHPTEVAAGLATARQMYANRRVWCVFQPHQVSRTEGLLGPFAESLTAADRIIVADVFAARENAGASVAELGRRLADHVAALGAQVIQLSTAGQIHDHLRRHVAPGDVVVTMGAGNIGIVAHELGQGLRAFRQAG